MLYYDNLYDIVFHRHEMVLCDELIVISGYVGPKPVHRVRELPMKTTVVYGMYASDGIHKSLHDSLLREENEQEKLTVLCSTMPVHTKAYMWLKNGQVVHSLIGSANFSMSGLNTPNKETLAETTIDTFSPLKQYKDLVFNNCISCADVKVRKTPAQVAEDIVWEGYDPNVCELPLYIEEDGSRIIPMASGINWGMAKLGGSHVNINDAYIPIPADCADHYPLLFPIKQTNPVNVDTVFRDGHRHNDTVEVIWDDGKEMTVLLEGSRGRLDENGNKIWYPKQIASSPSKAELGKYIRSRLGIPVGKAITYQDLMYYGRDSISVSLQGEGIYYFDFSPARAGTGNLITSAAFDSKAAEESEENIYQENEEEPDLMDVDYQEEIERHPGERSWASPQVEAGMSVINDFYGLGEIIEASDSYARVRFNTGEERDFPIPNAFITGHLKKFE